MVRITFLQSEKSRIKKNGKKFLNLIKIRKIEI